MSKPNNYPSWGKDLDIDSIISNIDSSRFSTGYPKDKGVYPTVDEWNYLGKMQNDWIKYLDAAVDDLDSRVSDNTSDIDSLSNRVTSNQSRISIIQEDMKAYQGLCGIQGETVDADFATVTPPIYKTLSGTLYSSGVAQYKIWQYVIENVSVEVQATTNTNVSFSLIIPEELRMSNNGNYGTEWPFGFVIPVRCTTDNENLMALVEPLYNNDITIGFKITIYDKVVDGGYTGTFQLSLISVVLRETV